MDRSTEGQNRRDFLRKFSKGTAVAAGVLASLSLLRQFFPRLSADRKRFKIGRKNNFPVNTYTYLPERELFVFRDHEGVQAVSAVCTHLGCIIEKTGDGFQCPCHGSCYNDKGEVISGAATKDLPWFALQKDVDGQLVVDQSRLVDPQHKLYV